MARVVLPLEPDDHQELQRLSQETGVPVPALIFMRMKGYQPISADRAQELARRPQRGARMRGRE